MGIIRLPVTPSLPPRTARGVLLLAVLVTSSGCFLFPIPHSTNPERPYVTSFEIDGTHAISAKELRDHLATQASGRRYLVLPAPQEFDQDAFANDKRRIVRYYQARGYYAARVDAAEVLPDGAGRVKIRVHVEEGQAVRVTQIEIEGLEQAPEARAKLRRLPIGTGDVFTEAAYDEARGAILAALTSTGWAKAEVTSRAEVDPALNQARLTYSVKTGERYRFGGVFVAGAAVIPRARIRAEAEPLVEPGTTFDSTDLPKAQARVFDMGVFGGVRVTPGPADAQKRTIPVVVSVREAPFRTIRAGPSLTFQATRWEADGVAGWSHRNWLGGLRKLNLDARAGYAWVPTVFNVQKQGLVGLGTADFTQPGTFARFVDLNLHAELEHGMEQAYDFNAERFRVGLPLRLGRLFTFIPSVNFELYQLSNAVTQPNANNTAQLQLATCPGHNPSLCLLSYFEQRIGIDLRDDPINTTRGFYLGVSVQEGFSAFGNGSSYLRLLPEARAFVNLGGGFVLAGRGRMGLLEALPGSNDVPIVARFTSGGPNFMRGYYTRQLAPALLACPNQSQTTTTCTDALQYVPIGGNGLVDGSFELRFPIVGQLAGAAFLDFGTVRFFAREALDLNNLQYAVGAGIRYKTVFGPLRVDIAGRLPRPDGNGPTIEVLQLKDDNTLAPVGKHAYPYVSVHLSIGEAF
jgi:translocation and assembly module TamA